MHEPPGLEHVHVRVVGSVAYERVVHRRVRFQVDVCEEEVAQVVERPTSRGTVSTAISRDAVGEYEARVLRLRARRCADAALVREERDLVARPAPIRRDGWPAGALIERAILTARDRLVSWSYSTYWSDAATWLPFTSTMKRRASSPSADAMGKSEASIRSARGGSARGS